MLVYGDTIWGRGKMTKDSEIEELYVKQMTTVAAAVDELFNKGLKPRETGFVLLVFPFGDAKAGRANYISNGADRKDIATLFKELAARFEGQPEMSGRG